MEKRMEKYDAAQAEKTETMTEFQERIESGEPINGREWKKWKKRLRRAESRVEKKYIKLTGEEPEAAKYEDRPDYAEDLSEDQRLGKAREYQEENYPIEGELKSERAKAKRAKRLEKLHLATDRILENEYIAESSVADRSTAFGQGDIEGCIRFTEDLWRAQQEIESAQAAAERQQRLAQKAGRVWERLFLAKEGGKALLEKAKGLFRRAEKAEEEYNAGEESESRRRGILDRFFGRRGQREKMAQQIDDLHRRIIREGGDPEAILSGRESGESDTAEVGEEAESVGVKIVDSLKDFVNRLKAEGVEVQITEEGIESQKREIAAAVRRYNQQKAESTRRVNELSTEAQEITAGAEVGA